MSGCTYVKFTTGEYNLEMTWVSDGLGTAGLMVALDGPTCIFQLKQFYDSTSMMVIPAGIVILL